MTPVTYILFAAIVVVILVARYLKRTEYSLNKLAATTDINMIDDVIADKQRSNKKILIIAMVLIVGLVATALVINKKVYNGNLFDADKQRVDLKANRFEQ